MSNTVTTTPHATSIVPRNRGKRGLTDRRRPVATLVDPWCRTAGGICSERSGGKWARGRDDGRPRQETKKAQTGNVLPSSLLSSPPGKPEVCGTPEWTVFRKTEDGTPREGGEERQVSVVNRKALFWEEHTKSPSGVKGPVFGSVMDRSMNAAVAAARFLERLTRLD
ncbi:hypothetical protein AND_002285 [Anopheles darlingi]|uniref:Uncharacterized protein n=1 Tax=Anopheles darlingi TaxID=43151 RepID=W5JSR5_ANODA|nr:hypothetical protein AND_002285 [Anopheles darlingi]